MDMSSQAELGIGSVKGRKDSEGQEASIDTKPLKENIADMMNLKSRADAAKERFSAAVKAVAEKSGLLSSVVRKLVNARSGEKFEDEKRKVDQCALIFEECGEENFRNMDVGNGRPTKPPAVSKDAGDPLAGSDLAQKPPAGLDQARLAEADKDAKETAAAKAKLQAAAQKKVGKGADDGKAPAALKH